MASPGRPSLFSKRLRQARERAGLTQQALGVRAGLDVSVAGPRINQYENGVHQPRQETMLDLAKALGVPAAYLTTSDDILARLLLAWPALTIEQRRKVADSIEKEAAKSARSAARTTRADIPAKKAAPATRRSPAKD